jgi:uncharacterized membrane protein
VKFGLRKIIVLFINLGLGIWLIGIIITPILAASEWPLGQKVSAFMYFFYKPVCHQIADRSFGIDGFTFTVCIRCFGYYLGGLLITSLYLFKEKINMWRMTSYILCVLPAFLDFLLEKTNIYSNIGGLRLLTGLMLGIAVFQLLFVSLFINKPKQKLNLLPEKFNRSASNN